MTLPSLPCHDPQTGEPVTPFSVGTVDFVPARNVSSGRAYMKHDPSENKIQRYRFKIGFRQGETPSFVIILFILLFCTMSNHGKDGFNLYPRFEKGQLSQGRCRCLSAQSEPSGETETGSLRARRAMMSSDIPRSLLLLLLLLLRSLMVAFEHEAR